MSDENKFVDYIKLRQEDDGWWYDEYANNHERVGNSDEGYSDKYGAMQAARSKHGEEIKFTE